MAIYIGPTERNALLSLALAASAAAGSCAATEAEHYASCAVALMRAAIGGPLTLDEAQALLVRCRLVGTPLETSCCEALAAMRARAAENDGHRGDS